MKRVFFLLFLVFAGVANAQDIAGTWQGKLTAPGASLRIVVHIDGSPGHYKASMDSPDQGAKGIPFNSIRVQDDSLFLELAIAGARYAGRVVNDTTIAGQWTQGASLPLDLRKTAAEVPVAELRRPQTPRPPFPYQSTDVIYYNRDSSIQYGATITRPEGKGPFPAMLLLTGSGPQNRDEEIFGHRPFAVIADHLTRRGYLVLRVDDRGVGKTTGFTKEATTKDFADDAVVSFEYLKSLPGVNKKKLGLLGHSEGGMIAQLVAAQRSDVAFVIKLAAPGQPVMDLMAGQNRAVLLASGMQAEAVNKYIELYRPLSAAIVNAPSDTAAMLEARRLIDNWMQTTTPANILATTGIRDEATKQAFIDQFIRQLRQPWFRYFMQYDPDPFIRKTGAKVLALNGDRDIQVVSSDNLPALKASLQRSRSPKFDIVELKGLNHLFQRCSRCTVDEYMQLEETFAPEALETISAWLDKNVR